MIISDQQREENFQEYLRLSKDPNYYDVTFDEQSGGISAIHKEHRFDKQLGPFGYKRGQYEMNALMVLRRSGHQIVLLSERTDVGTKQFDALLDGFPCEIKTVEGSGRWAIRTKIYDAARQGAYYVVLLFPFSGLYDTDRIKEGWIMYEEAREINNKWHALSGIFTIIGSSQLEEIEKPPW